jgi:hypothetical protein
MHPFVYPFDEVVYLAAWRAARGVLVHACGIRAPRPRHPAPRHERRRQEHLGAPVVRRPATTDPVGRSHRHPSDGRRPRIFGTPWHGEAGIESPGSAPLHAVFILEQAPRNRVIDLPPLGRGGADDGARLPGRGGSGRAWNSRPQFLASR